MPLSSQLSERESRKQGTPLPTDRWVEIRDSGRFVCFDCPPRQAGGLSSLQSGCFYVVVAVGVCDHHGGEVARKTINSTPDRGSLYASSAKAIVSERNCYRSKIRRSLPFV